MQDVSRGTKSEIENFGLDEIEELDLGRGEKGDFDVPRGTAFLWVRRHRADQQESFLGAGDFVRRAPGPAQMG